MNTYHFSFSVDANVEAEDLDEAWAAVKNHMDDRFWGPTAVNIELVGKKEEASEEAI